MAPLKMKFDELTGTATIYVGAAREKFSLNGTENQTTSEEADRLFKFFRFAYSQGVNDAAREVSHKAHEIVKKLILEE